MSQVIKVGLFFTVGLAVLGYLILEVEDLRLFGGEEQRVDVLFDSVVGLDDKAPVRVAGVRVGRVDGITLEGRRARVSVLLETPVPLTEGSRASVANAGILGDKYVELIPGPLEAPPLAPGTALEGTAPISFDQALEQVGELADSFGTVAGDLAGRDLGTTIERLLTNLEATSSDIRDLVRANRDAVSATAGNFERASAALAVELPRLSQQLSGLLAQVEAIVSENRDELRAGLGGIRELSDKLQVSVENLNQISGQIASGEGSLGKLVYSDQAHDSLVSTLDSVEEGVSTLNDTLGRVAKIDFRLGLEGAYFTGLEESRSAVSLRLQPATSSRFYFAELVDDPGGKRRSRTEVITTTLPDGTMETTTIERVTIEDEFTLSAQVGFRLDRFDLRAGLIESTGGGAVDLGLLADRRLHLSLEAFDFSRENDLDPHLRLTGRFQLSPNVYLLGGYDDFLVGGRESFFLGAGIRWRDEDLKYLLGSIPTF